MCWLGRKSNKCIAQEDITCYKVVFHNLLSAVQLFQYEVGKTYSTELKIEENINIKDRERICIYEGFHCYMQKHPIIKYRCSKSLIVLTCKIPKGSIYYKNEHDLGVTTKLVVEKATPCNQFLK